jgi:hypothetical protein
MLNNDISNAENGISYVALAFGVSEEHANVKRNQAALNNQWLLLYPVIHKSQEYNIECDGYIFWKTHMENLLQFLQRTLAKTHF